MANSTFLGIDVGATGMKGGLVDVRKGTMLTERFRFDTPKPATPMAMTNTFRKLIDEIGYRGPIGVGFPAVVNRNVARTAANIDESWIGTDIAKVFGQQVEMPVHTINDADAAGIATMRFGIGKKFRKEGTVLMITIGTGLGSALFQDGKLVPNLELGSLYLRNQKVIAEKYVSNKVRKDTDMSMKEFGKKLNEYLSHVDQLLNPDLIVLGGGGSKYFEDYKRYLRTNATVRPAKFGNTAGTVGAALYAAERASS